MDSAARAWEIRSDNALWWRAITSRRAAADGAASISRMSATPKPACFAGKVDATLQFNAGLSGDR